MNFKKSINSSLFNDYKISISSFDDVTNIKELKNYIINGNLKAALFNTEMVFENRKIILI